MFCGKSYARLHETSGQTYPAVAFVHCTYCKARGPVKEHVQEAIDAWNKVKR